MSAPAPASAVGSTRFRLAEIAATGSTNVDVAAWIRSGLRADYALRADHQTAGRGRRDRSWEAPPGSGLMLSIALEVDADGDVDGDARRLSPSAAAAAVGLAAYRACRGLGADLSMKWPNDLIGPVGTDGTPPKVAGVLGELVVVDDRLVAVVGIGLNLRPVPDRAAALGRSVAVLDELCTGEPSPHEMAVLVLEQLEGVLDSIATSGSAWLAEELSTASGLIGRQLTVDLGEQVIDGVADSIDGEGRLVLTTAHGTTTLVVGDVVSARLT